MASTSSSAEVEIIPVLSDNYAYLLIDPATKCAAAIDPVEPEKVLQKARERGVKVTHILTTHQHWDHAGGNEKFVSLQPDVVVIGGEGDSVPCALVEVGHGDFLAVGRLKVRSTLLPARKHAPYSVVVLVDVLFTPCHTPGHVCYYVDVDAPLVFTGDTMFVAGCGNFNSGTPAMMHHAMIEVLGKLPPATRVYCGHEYTEKNLRFAAFADPDNKHIKDKQRHVRALHAEGKPSVPSTIEEEWQTNPFLRLDSPAIRAFTGAKDQVAAMKAVRKGKDEWGRRG